MTRAKRRPPREPVRDAAARAIGVLCALLAAVATLCAVSAWMARHGGEATLIARDAAGGAAVGTAAADTAAGTAAVGTAAGGAAVGTAAVDAAVAPAIAEAGSRDDSLVDINTADAERLCTLSGVGPVLAESILAERARNGRFRCAEELIVVKGIGEKTLAKLLPHITVSPAEAVAPQSVAPQSDAPQSNAP